MCMLCTHSVGDVVVVCIGIIRRRCQQPRRHCRGPVSVHGRPPGPRSDSNWLWSTVLYPSNTTVLHSLEKGTGGAYRQPICGLYCILGSQRCPHRSGPDSKSRGGNLPPVRALPSLVDQHIEAESTAGRLLGPIPPHLASACQISPIGLIPKPHQPANI